MSSRIHAVVLNWNNYADAREALASLQASIPPLAGILLVDNGSDDGSLNQLREHFPQGSGVSFLENGANLGFAEGVNAGIRHVLREGADAVLLVNNDAVVAPDCVVGLVEALDAAPEAGLAAPRIFFHARPDRVWLGGGYYRRWKSGPVILEKNKRAKELTTQTLEVSFLTGCVMLVRRTVFERIGLFAREFYFYEEDVDFCLRADRAGFRLLYVPAAEAWHKIEDVAQDRTSPFVLYHLARSRMLLVRKNFSAAYVAYALLMHLTIFTPYRVLQWVRGSRAPGALQAWFRGTWAGITHPLQP